MHPNRPFRFAILAGVSTDAQADEKASIPDQIDTCRRVIHEWRGIETACHIMDGYSRTGYDSLADAMEDIPPLKQAIEGAEQNQYDVLILDNWDRLGDLGQLVHTRFRKYRKQIYSARQSGRVHDPATYDPYADESAGIDMHIQGIIQTYRINKMRRGWNVGVPMRIEKGLHPLSLPYGYQLAGQGQPATLIPEKAALIKQMKDWMLAGQTYAEIARRADQSQIPPPRGASWSRQTVQRILTNPFYAGIVRFGKLRNRIPTQISEWKQGQGKHEALWDEATYRALVAEAKRRVESKRDYAAKYPFSGLTVCGICGAKIQKHGSPPFEYLVCKKPRRHWSMRYEKALDLLTWELVRQLQHHQASPHKPADLAPLRTQLEGIKARRARVQTGYEASIYEAAEASQKLNALQEEAEEISRRLERAQNQEHLRREWEERMGGLQEMIEEIPVAIRHGDPVRTNQLLSALIDKIILCGESVEIIWRD